MNFLKKLRFSSWRRTKVRCQGPPGIAKAQPWESSNICMCLLAIPHSLVHFSDFVTSASCAPDE